MRWVTMFGAVCGSLLLNTCAHEGQQVAVNTIPDRTSATEGPLTYILPLSAYGVADFCVEQGPEMTVRYRCTSVLEVRRFVAHSQRAN